MKTNEENAIQYIMEFYRVSREVACEFYWDEVEAYIRSFEPKNKNISELNDEHTNKTMD